MILHYNRSYYNPHVYFKRNRSKSNIIYDNNSTTRLNVTIKEITEDNIDNSNNAVEYDEYETMRTWYEFYDW